MADGRVGREIGGNAGQRGDFAPQAQRVDRRLSPDTIAELVQAYRDGASTTELRRHYELSQGSVIKLLHENSVAMRNQGLVGGDVATATELYQSGATLAQLGERFSARWMALGMGTKPRS